MPNGVIFKSTFVTNFLIGIVCHLSCSGGCNAVDDDGGVPAAAASVILHDSGASRGGAAFSSRGSAHIRYTSTEGFAPGTADTDSADPGTRDHKRPTGTGTDSHTAAHQHHPAL